MLSSYKLLNFIMALIVGIKGQVKQNLKVFLACVSSRRYPMVWALMLRHCSHWHFQQQKSPPRCHIIYIHREHSDQPDQASEDGEYYNDHYSGKGVQVVERAEVYQNDQKGGAEHRAE